MVLSLETQTALFEVSLPGPPLSPFSSHILPSSRHFIFNFFSYRVPENGDDGNLHHPVSLLLSQCRRVAVSTSRHKVKHRHYYRSTTSGPSARRRSSCFDDDKDKTYVRSNVYFADGHDVPGLRSRSFNYHNQVFPFWWLSCTKLASLFIY